MSAPTVAEVLETSDNRTIAETLTTSASTLAGDTLVIFYGSDYYSLTDMPDVSTDAGVPELVQVVSGGDTKGHLKAYTLVVPGNGAVHVTIPAHINCDIHGVVLRIPGGAVVDDHDGSFDADGVGSSHVAPSVDAAGLDRLLVCGWLAAAGISSSFSGDPYLVPGTMVKAGQTAASPYSAMCTAIEPVSAGSTGTRTAIWVATKPYTAISLVLAPVVVADIVTGSAALTGSSVLTVSGSRVVRGAVVMSGRVTATTQAKVRAVSALTLTASAALTVAVRVLQAPIPLSGLVRLIVAARVRVLTRIALSADMTMGVTAFDAPTDPTGRIVSVVYAEGTATSRAEVTTTTGGGP